MAAPRIQPPAGASNKVMGGHMQALMRNISTYDGDAFAANINNWRDVHGAFGQQKLYLEQSGKAVPDAFHHSSYVGAHGEEKFKTASAGVDDKNGTLRNAVDSLQIAKERSDHAHAAYHRLLPTLPDAGTYMAMPNPNSPQYAQSGIGIDKHQATANSKQLAADKATHASQQQAIAAAEQEAAHHNQQIEEAFNDARPKVQALFHEPNPDTPPGTTPTGQAAGDPNYAPGGRSKAEAARAQLAQISPESYGARAQSEHLQGVIQDAVHHGGAEWDASQGMWVNADGSPADAAAYASVSVDGQSHSLSSLLGGTSGMVSAGLGVGGLGGGLVALARNKMAATASAEMATARSASGARVGAMSSSKNAKLFGGGSRGAGASGRSGAGAGAGKAGTRAGAAGSRGGRGAGAGGRGKGKDKKGPGKGNEYLADYTEDWLDPNEPLSDEAYDKIMERKRRDEGR